LNDGLHNNSINSSSKHPLIGLVDHISVMPLTNDNNKEWNALSNNNSDDPQKQMQTQTQNQNQTPYIPPDSHGLCSVYIGDKMLQHNKNIDVFYYGSAHPNHVPLATIRREKTKFFQSGGLDSKSTIDTTTNTTDNSNNHNHNHETKPKDQCTIGSPTSFVENYNILLSRNVNKKQAMKLTKKIRERDGGIIGVEGLTLPYSEGRYEVACNLLHPKEGSSDDILRVLDEWVRDQKDQLEEEEEQQQRQQHLDVLGDGMNKIDYFVDKSYRVGTTAEQCMDVLNRFDQEKGDTKADYDLEVAERFRQYFVPKIESL
jgi:hypothetical protein